MLLQVSQFSLSVVLSRKGWGQFSPPDLVISSRVRCRVSREIVELIQLLDVATSDGVCGAARGGRTTHAAPGQSAGMAAGYAATLSLSLSLGRGVQVELFNCSLYLKLN